MSSLLRHFRSCSRLSLASAIILTFVRGEPRSHVLFNIAGWIVALGGTTALDTLGSQAYTGGSEKTDLSIHFQRCLVILWILLIPVACLWAWVESVLLSFGQSEHLARDVQQFLRLLLFGAPAYVGFESLKKYLQCQGLPNLFNMMAVILI